jgi:hypothetical protein
MDIGPFLRIHPAYGVVLLLSFFGLGFGVLSRSCR